MTSLPSPPQFGALPPLPPLPGRDSSASGLPALAGLLEGFEAETGRAPLARGFSPGEPLRNPLDGYIRSDGSTPLGAGEAARLADALAMGMRQTPSHPLQRDLQQLPPESVRQLLDFVARHVPAGREVPAHVADALLQGAGPGGEARPTEARTLAEGARQQAFAAAGPGERVAAGVVRDTAAAPGRMAEEAGPRTAATASGLRVMNEAAIPSGQAQRPGAETGNGSPLAGSMGRELAAGTRQESAGVHGAQPAFPAPPAAAAAATAATTPLPQELAVAQALHARVAGEAATVPGRADAAPTTAEGIGLPGFGAAAGLTLAAVVQPAGTTFAHAPTTTPRTPVRDQARDARATRAPEDQARHGQQRDQRRQPPSDGRAAPDSDTSRPGQRGGANGRATGADAVQAGTGAATGRTTATSTTATTRASAPSPDAMPGSTSSSPTDASNSAAVPPGTTAQAATRVWRGREPLTEAPAPPAAAARPSAQAVRAYRLQDAAAQGGEPDHTPGLGGNRRLRRRQWLYWSLIAVTYACLAAALATLLPDRFELPIGEAHRPYWRHGLTIFGLVTGLVAWWLARRTRWTS